MQRRDHFDDDKPCTCPKCGWTGTLGQTDDYTPTGGEPVAVCPKCRDETAVLPCKQ